jgi:hypothetical protein
MSTAQAASVSPILWRRRAKGSEYHVFTAKGGGTQMRSRWTAYRLIVMVAGIFLLGVLPVTSQMPDLGAFGPDGREADRQSKMLACLRSIE